MTIVTLIADALFRLNLTPSEATGNALAQLGQYLDERLHTLDPFAQLELRNVIEDYAINWATAEVFELAAGDQGPVTPAGRPNPVLTRAATNRSRMRQALTRIKAILKAASKPQGEGEGLSASGVAPAEPPRISTKTPASAEATRREGEAPAEPPRTLPALAEPAAPPMNRAERRAQARLEAKLRRKAKKRLNHAATA